jgi:hypothetical protein
VGCIFNSAGLIITHEIPYPMLEYTGCLIREFRIQSVVEKDPVELEKYLEKKIRSS